MNLSKKIKRGFTLIEILLVVAILSILLVVVFAALNPATRLADTRNARRWSDVNSVLTAFHECVVDDGTSAAWTNCGLADTQAYTQLGTCVSGGATLCATAAAACDDVTTELASYLASIPLDPSDGSAATTGYAVETVSGLLTVTACSAEGTTISVSR